MNDLLRVFFTAPASLIVLFLMTKLIGNKQMSELNMFDYINGITIGSIAAEMATDTMAEFYPCVVAIVLYSVIAVFLTFLSQKSLFMRRFITGKSIILYDKGKLFYKNFKTAKLDIDEFLVMCRTKGYFNLDEIQTIIMEANGQLSILPNDKDRPLTPNDMKITVNQSRPEIVVINDGKILEKNLKYSGNNKNWLDKNLKKQKISLNEIFVAFCDDTNNLKIYKKSNKNPTNDIFD